MALNSFFKYYKYEIYFFVLYDSLQAWKRKIDRYEFDYGHIIYHTMSKVNDIQVLHRLDSP